MKINKRAYSEWILLMALMVVLLIGYGIAEINHHEEFDSYLKGLSFSEHFFIHFSVGIFFGLMILSVYTWMKDKFLNEPLILSLTIFLSHWPDIIFAITQKPHSPWEIIFLLHTVADEIPYAFWIFLILDIALFMVYLKMKKASAIS